MAPTVINGTNGVEAYRRVVETVIRYGQGRPSRAGNTLDLGHVITFLESPYAALPLGVGRRVNRKIAAAEACQLIGGFSDPDLMLNASPNFARYMEPGTRSFHGAYGVRIQHQFAAAVHKLHEKNDSRQAVMTLWDPLLDNQPDKRDYPCTVALQFEIVGNRLNMHVFMRSNDVWLGVPYDWFQFTQLQLTACNVIGVEPGSYTHQSLSTHLYTRDLDNAARLTDLTADGWTESATPRGFGVPAEYAIFKVMQRAKQVTRHEIPDATVSEEWFRAQFRPVPHPSRLAVDVASGGEGPGPAQPMQS